MRINEKKLAAMKELSNVEKKFTDLDNVVFEQGFGMETRQVYNAAINLYDAVEDFIEALEELDENMNPETTNLPNIDKIFKDHPASDYVHSLFDAVLGSGSIDDVKEAAKNLENYQRDMHGKVEDKEEDCEDVGLLAYIEEVDATHVDEVNENLDMIEKYLDGKSEFNDDDVKLIRYYLTHLPQHSLNEVESMEDKTVKLAYRQLQFIRRILQ